MSSSQHYQPTAGTQPQPTGTPSPQRSSEAGPSRTVVAPQHQEPYPPRPLSVASRTSQTSYESTTLLARARAMGRNLFQRRALPAHPENHSPPILTPVSQLPPTVAPDREWASRVEAELPTQSTSHLVSSLLGIDPQSHLQLQRAPTPHVPHSEEECLSPITLGSTPSHTPKSPVPSPLTTLMSPAQSQVLSPRHVPGTLPMESQEANPPLPPIQDPTMDLDEAIWQYLTRRLERPPPILQNASIDDLFHHYTRTLREDPVWLLTTAGQDYTHFTYQTNINVIYILREEAAVHAASTWNRVHPRNEQVAVLPGYQPPEIDLPKPMLADPEIPPRHAKVLAYPLKPRHPMGSRYAGGADPRGDQGGDDVPDDDPTHPSDLADPNLRSLP
ncbi:hypothetical protein ARMSODRAFT_1024683 [Armillaria solidipes]|uniref:Uncharacterized protein n=1 Tax=Armillaria solidipes TaxID=1076256 RepID=A0A2H3BI19_9AGAR|nr:hypothetical protein ARMSODRAFT_1024683 [Armillaria solidipes]